MKALLTAAVIAATLFGQAQAGETDRPKVFGCIYDKIGVERMTELLPWIVQTVAAPAGKKRTRDIESYGLFLLELADQCDGVMIFVRDKKASLALGEYMAGRWAADIVAAQ